ncbi:nucleotide pyrophosphohydrolase [Virgibacillus pantothenticus]|uniref:Nucleotide pyrophosphohydrolase n=1 Tax=Virgibacillus pantothenticus TaxID=1473 RepID=A0A0L0QRU2_VIRPA|nr:MULTISPECIES: nucleotide pyrophosphohydrolase [Virgibacillus]API92122.1 nucleotide pyrophosphohydrolase [Virgibacillus sp. 6R]KNE21266.1 nucleotide pyrophosphohydrolase [Virgibacillus pantothenticus]MBS7430591.1 nucleotide pyrophosphohydrolase [Virgibacillus sp. 19R1-5]MBU8568359.1 nucleotide pyrophosphohydrolase [Virgibacillus pantothenticus]MBU8602368.1 nucleotide pyrophosphohydrolase [Virgibacillus pantothenticus]
MSDIGKLIQEINAFRDDRDWRQFHNPKDLAISLSLEAAELLEDFQWKTSEQAIEANMENIKEELADVMIYAFMLSDDLNLDIKEIILEKMQKNAKKYPVEKSKGRKMKYHDL